MARAAARRRPVGRAAGCAAEALERRVLFAVTTETFTGGKGPFTTTFEYFNNALHPRGISDGSETLRLTSNASFQALNFKVTHNGGSGSVTRMRLIGYSAANSVIYDNQFNTPPNTPVTITVNTKVARLEFQPITVLQNGQQFVGSGVLRTVVDDFQYDPQVAGNTPPQLTGLGAGQLGSFRENGQLSIFSTPQLGIQASLQDSDNDTLTVEVQADDPDRGLMIGSDVDGDGKYFTPVPGQPHILRLVGTPAQTTTAIREVYLYFANVDDVTDTGRDYTTTFTVRINDGTNPVVTATVQGVLHGVNEAPTITTTAAAAALLNQFTYDRDFVSPFATFTVDDPDSKPVLPSNDVAPDVLHVDVGFPDANGTLVGAGWSKTGVSNGTATWRFNGNYLQATTAVRTVQFNPTDRFVPGNLTTTNFTLKVTDSGDPFDNDPQRGAPLSFTFASAVSVRAKTNTSPTLGGGPLNRAAIPEGGTSPAVPVASLVAAPNAMGDVDADQRKGIAIVAAPGTWQYSTDGTNWANVGTVSASAALVLSDTSFVRFLGSDANGPLSFTYKAWDRSSWLTNLGGTASTFAARVLVDASGFSATPQNVSPFSLASVLNSQPVTAVNDAPNVVNGATAALAPIAEDAANPAGQTVSGLYASHFSDADDDQTAIGGSAANNFAGVAVTANAQTAATGAWQYSTGGGVWTGIGTAVSDANALLLGPAALVRFLPAADFNGPAPALTVRLVDDSAGAIASGTTANAAAGGDPSRYSAATIATGQTVTAVNDAPTIVGTPLAAPAPVAEDAANPPGATVASLFASMFSDAADQVPGGSAANTMAGVAITANPATPAQGKWQYFANNAWADVLGAAAPNAILVAAGSSIRFLPAANFNGLAPALTVRLVDNSAGAVVTGAVANVATTGGTTAFSAGTASVGQAVTEVNDAPSAVADALAAVPEDSGQRTIPFAALTGNDSVGPANEFGQALVVRTVGGATGGTVSIVGTNVLFTPAADFNGAAGFTYTVGDNGTTNGAANPLTGAAAVAVSFGVTEVNDAPDAVDDTLTAVAQGSGQRVIPIAGLTGNDTKGAANEASQAIGLVSVGGAVGGTVSISASNVLFDLAPGFSGTASFTYTLTDNGTTNGAADARSDVGTVTFSVPATNVSVAVAPAAVDENAAGNLVYTFTRTGITTAALLVNFRLAAAGTATLADNDFAVVTNAATTFVPATGLGTVTFAAGAATASLSLDPTADAVAEGNETAVVAVAAGTAYSPQAGADVATGTIRNDDRPAVTGMRVNDGSAQRSTVTSLTVTFSGPVASFDAGAFALARRGAAGATAVPVTAALAADGRTAVLTFGGAGSAGGVLGDGVYDLLVRPALVREANGLTGAGADQSYAFHCLFSDADGDGDSDNSDLFQFRASYGRSAGDPAYRAYFDFDADGDVDNADLFQVRSRRGVEYKGY